MLKFKCPIIFFVETPFLTMITGTTPLSASHLWIPTIASLATPPSSDCTKTVFRGSQYQVSRIWLTCVWYCNIGNLQIVFSKSDTSPTCPNLSPRCPNKFFMSEPSGVIGCWLSHPEFELSVGIISFGETTVSATIHQSNTSSGRFAHAISPSNQHETTLIQTWTTKAPTATSHRRSSRGMCVNLLMNNQMRYFSCCLFTTGNRISSNSRGFCRFNIS